VAINWEALEQKYQIAADVEAEDGGKRCRRDMEVDVGTDEACGTQEEWNELDFEESTLGSDAKSVDGPFPFAEKRMQPVDVPLDFLSSAS
jgi:hypothetical protein